jgi:hypothetical protein
MNYANALFFILLIIIIIIIYNYSLNLSRNEK